MSWQGIKPELLYQQMVINGMRLFGCNIAARLHGSAILTACVCCLVSAEVNAPAGTRQYGLAVKSLFFMQSGDGREGFRVKYLLRWPVFPNKIRYSLPKDISYAQFHVIPARQNYFNVY